MNTERTIANIEHGDSVTISIVPKDDGRWFRVLNRLIDAEYWALLPDTARNVLIVLARHRGENGLAKADNAALCRGSKLAKSTVHKALVALLEHNPPLIAKHGPDLWELFPGWAFASRRAESPPGDSSLQPENRVSGQRPSPLARSESSVFLSAQQEENKTTTTEPRAGARGLSAESSSVVVVLLGEGLSKPDAERIAPTTTMAQVRKAIANANHLAKRGELTSRRGYIIAAIKGEYSLFAKVEERAAKALADKLGPLSQSGHWPLDPDTTERIYRRYGGALGIVRACVVSPEEIAELNELELVGVIAERAGVKKS